jgi:hypothetical protein
MCENVEWIYLAEGMEDDGSCVYSLQFCWRCREFVSRIVEKWEVSNNLLRASQQENNSQSAYLRGPLIVACTVAPVTYVKTDWYRCNFGFHGSINCQICNQSWGDGGWIRWFEQCNEGSGYSPCCMTTDTKKCQFSNLSTKVSIWN